MKHKCTMLMLTIAIIFFIASCATVEDNDTQSQGVEQKQQTVKEYKLGGQGPGGGIIFYDDQLGFDFNKDGQISDDEKNIFQNTYLAGSRFLEAAKRGWNLSESGDDPRAAWGGDDANIQEIEDVQMTLITGEADKIKATVGNGRYNTEKIVAYLGENTDETSTAAQLCNKYDGGGLSDWFLPSMGELVLLHAMKDEAGGMALDSYNSSSEAMFNNLRWVVIFREDKPEFDTIRKYKPWYVRPIRAF